MTDYTRFTAATHIKVYFCDPQNRWQRGSLLRPYFPKRTIFRPIRRPSLTL